MVIKYSKPYTGDSQNDKLYGVSESHIQQCSDCIAHTTGDTLGRMTEEASEWDNGNSIQGKYDRWADTGEVDGYAYRHEDKEYIDDTR